MGIWIRIGGTAVPRSSNHICYLGNPGPLLAGTLLGQVWAEREEKLRGGAGKASRLRVGNNWQGHELEASKRPG